MSKSIADRLKDSGFKDVSRGTLTYLYPDDLTVVVDPAHPLYDPRVEWPLDLAKVADIRERGVMHPILIRENGEDAKGRPILEVIDGRRRVLHAREVNKGLKNGSRIRVPVVFAHGDDIQMVLHAIALNANREDETVHSRAVKVQKVIKLGATVEDVAKALCTTTKTVGVLLAYLNLHKNVQKAIDAGQIPVGSIASFAKVPREEQEAMLEKVRVSGATKRHEVADAVSAHKKGEDYVAPDRKKAWGRAELKRLRSTLDVAGSSKEVRVAKALIDLFLGDGEALVEFPTVAAAICVSSEKKKEARS